MKLLLATFLLFIFAQGGQPISVPIQHHQFELGYAATFAQTLPVSPRTVQSPSPGWQYGTEGVYTLTFSVANYFPNYPGYYTAEIGFGSQELCEASGWGTSHPSQVIVTCPSSNYLVIDKALPGGGAVQGNEPLVLHFTVNDGSPNGGWPVLFDDVSLTFTPN